MSRPTWDEYWMGFARLAATRATCPRASVGAVVIRDNRIIATGYNGAPPGVPECFGPSVGCLMENGHCIRATHAELNALLAAARYGARVDGSTLYVTHEPCVRCARDIVSAGVAEVVFEKPYRSHPWAREVLEAGGVHVLSFRDAMSYIG